MKQFVLVSVLVLLFINKQYAQTKVFKEVGNSISSSIKAIIQDDNLVGYLSFTELERANADSFHYRLTIMDENLNDIGELNFTELKLDLQAVAFEQDVMCLAYLKSNFVGYGGKKRKERKEQLSNASLSVYTQFVSLDGKIINSNTVKANVKIMSAYNTGYDRNKIDDGVLKHRVQLKNMKGKGFACFYGDDNKCYVSVFNTEGKSVWNNDFMQGADNFVMLTSQHDIYLLYKKKEKLLEGGYWLMGYNVDNNAAFAKYDLSDKNGHSFSVRAFANDPITGRPYLAGMILHNRKGNSTMTVKQLAHGPYIGAFTAQIKNSGTSDIETVISDWSSHSQSEFSSKGRYQPTKSFMLFQPAFKDYDGNAYFAGTSFKRKPKWGAIGATVATSPLIIPPLWILMFAGTQKIQTRDALLFKQDKKGNLSYVTAIPSAHSRYITGKVSLLQNMAIPEYDMVVNSDTKSNYLVVSDKKNVNIYSVNQKKVIRTIPRKEGSVTTTIYPAKEGHIMVSEYNKQEKTRKFSIESL
ncbi:DUF6770 family protein [Chitinophaga pinensis]|uniref:Uncharacterized protein n=1 Tax=Chitinophaga pinensis (strain ATCC 43595 / DSM 2588 / LMG 13176 / NBRC 15968 / NCIMB 11800 / UQM 2034) TaxID=485918 RepID=A0A979GCH9_CHIPD|nr:DUF6770 family protein [Chitinophaga pinensis]ACU64513.1 hypothetical protein Cpin_7112 [Chitinophaga pinensis DSM 2588]